MMYWATWVQVTDRIPPSTEQKSTPIRPEEDAHVEVDADESRDDEADAGHLGDEVHERAGDGATTPTTRAALPP